MPPKPKEINPAPLNPIPPGYAWGKAPDGRQYIVPQMLLPDLQMAFAGHAAKIHDQIGSKKPKVSISFCPISSVVTAARYDRNRFCSIPGDDAVRASTIQMCRSGGPLIPSLRKRARHLLTCLTSSHNANRFFRRTWVEDYSNIHLIQ